MAFLTTELLSHTLRPIRVEVTPPSDLPRPNTKHLSCEQVVGIIFGPVARWQAPRVVFTAGLLTKIAPLGHSDYCRRSDFGLGMTFPDGRR